MMDGQIFVRSKIGEGTVVKVSFPLSRPDPTENTLALSISTSYSGQPQLAKSLKEGISGSTVSIFDFVPSTRISSENRPCNAIIADYLVDWCGATLVPWSPDAVADMIVADEEDLVKLQESCQKRKFQALVVLCGNVLSYTRDSSTLSVPAHIVEMISKPCGPYKVAGAVRLCLEKAKALNIEAQDVTPVSETRNAVDSNPPTPLEAYQVTMAVSSSSMMAEPSAVELMIENTANVHLTEVTATKDAQNNTVLVPVEESNVTNEVTINKTPALDVVSIPQTPEERQKELATNLQTTTAKPISVPMPNNEEGLKILVVDDNQINLKLLQTFLKRRKPVILDTAENGRLAVEAVEKNSRGYDIIFMGMSAPPSSTMDTY